MTVQVRVVGVGCGGVNAVSAMAARRPFETLRFIAADTDGGKIREARADLRIQIGKKLTRGHGAAGDPQRGREAAEESTGSLRAGLDRADLVFMAAGLGGGTGTGAGPVVARLARSLGALVVSIVTRPFSWEGKEKEAVAREGLAELREASDALVVIANDRIVELATAGTPAEQCYRLSDGILQTAISSIADILSPRNVIQNVDFADFRRVLSGAGTALFGVGEATGANRAAEAARQALRSRLLENTSLQSARRLLVNITGGKDLGMVEIPQAMEVIRSHVKSDGYQCFGFVSDEGFAGRVRVTVVAAGLADARPALPSPGRTDPRFPVDEEIQIPAWKRLQSRAGP